MKKIIMFFLFAFFSTLAFADWASDSLENARAEDAAVIKKISKERTELRARLEKLSSEISALDKKLEDLSAKKNESLALSDKSKYYDSMARQILVAVERGFSADGDGIVTFPEISNFVIACETEFKKEMFNPFEGKRGSVKRAKTGDVLDGEIFKVGAFSYFTSQSTSGFVSDGILYGEEFSKEISDFYSGKSKTIPADISNGTFLSELKKRRSFTDDIILGGVWIYPILIFGILSIGVLILKIFLFLSIRRSPKNLMKKIADALANDNLATAEKLAKSVGYPYSELLIELVNSRDLGTSALEEISYEKMLSAGERVFGGLSVLSVSATVSPLLGLLGTVTGIIKTFGDLSNRGAEQAQFISAGISEALITTEYGLIVAIPAFVAHAILSRRAKGILSDMEKMASSFIATYKK